MNKIILGIISIFLFYGSLQGQIFTRITEGEIVKETGASNGCSWADYNNDGYLDLFVVCDNSEKNHLYKNKGDGTFNVVFCGQLTNMGSPTPGCSWGDYDNDGYLDLFVTALDFTKNFLYKNNGDNTFTPIVHEVIQPEGNASFGISWGDYNNDGYLDIFVANGGWIGSQKNFLYHNNGDGTFTKINTGTIINDNGASRGCSWGDYDNDGDLDLYVTNQDFDNFFYENNGNGTFSKIVSEITDSYEIYAIGSSWGDYDNDGDLDLFITNCWGEKNQLYINNGDKTFTKVTHGNIVNDEETSWGSSWGDYDNDGDLDLFVGNWGNNSLYQNNGDGTFRKITNDFIVKDGGDSQGCVWGDYDRDGDLDLFVVNKNDQQNLLYQNNGNSNNWVNIKCIGVYSNRSAIGVKVRIKAEINGAEVWQMREISTQTGYCAQNSLNAHFGLGDATKIDSIKIEWPSDTIDVMTDIAVNQFIKMFEDAKSSKISISAKQFDFDSVLIGFPEHMKLIISYIGTEELIINNIISDNSDFTVDPTNFVLGPGQSREVYITFSPDSSGVSSGTLVIESNDPVSILILNLNGYASFPPVIFITPDEFQADLLHGDTIQKTLTLLNNGGSDLIFTINLLEVLDTNKTDTKSGNKICGDFSFSAAGFFQNWNIKPEQSFNSKGSKVIKRNESTDEFWQLLYTDPDELDLTYDIKNIFADISNDEIRFKLESYKSWDDPFYQGVTAIYIDADQEISTGYNPDTEREFGWQLGIDYVITRDFSLYENGLYAWNDLIKKFERIENLSANIITNNSNELILGVLRQHLRKYSAINFALLSGYRYDQHGDYVPDPGKGHITFYFPIPWLDLNITEGVIQPDNQQEITITFKALNLIAGDYKAKLLLLTNDPAVNTDTIPISLTVNSATGLREDITMVQNEFLLNPCHPNPFSSKTIISYHLPEETMVNLSIYDIFGKLVTTLVKQRQSPGSYFIEWNATNFPAGIYFYRIEAGKFCNTRKCLLIN
ncbi:MAG: VCBS repeat-containing protein [Bacteroidales bacterium]|nr:VCBS repeat-containing protein [Bacteroidales bacterium]